MRNLFLLALVLGLAGCSYRAPFLANTLSLNDQLILKCDRNCCEVNGCTSRWDLRVHSWKSCPFHRTGREVFAVVLAPLWCAGQYAGWIDEDAYQLDYWHAQHEEEYGQPDCKSKTLLHFDKHGHPIPEPES